MQQTSRALIAAKAALCSKRFAQNCTKLSRKVFADLRRFAQICSKCYTGCYKQICSNCYTERSREALEKALRKAP
jgi:hypothetical protein